jgi:uncharacterized repeat protein (TIGR01451 family)
MQRHKPMAHRADGRGQRRLRRPDVEALEERGLLATITVTGTGDTIANDGAVTLREAITAANTNADPSGDTTPGDSGLDTIAFNIPGTGVRTIHLTSALPTITEPVVIDGYTQPGSAPNTLPDGDDAVLLIELSRGDLGINGLTITAGGSTVRGMVINGNTTNVTYGIELRTNGGNLIEGNFIGPDATGTADVGTQGTGVLIQNAASNTIGGTTPAARNVISGNSVGSIEILGSPASGNLVEGNFIGTNAAGTARLTPTEAGQVAIIGAPNTTIGGTTSGARNVITGSSTGIGISNSGATGNLVQGNYIGIDVSGTTPLATSGSSGLGVAVGTSSTGTTIGGTTSGARNIISGNPGGGIGIVGFAEMDTLVQGNYIGTDASGVAAVPNGGPGVQVGPAGPDGTTIGGTTPEARNIISGNNGDGVRLEADASGIVVQGNFIGINVNRDPLGNRDNGVLVELSGASIGGATAEAGNVIAFNGLSGVRIPGPAGGPFNINNVVQFNAISANGGLGIDLSDLGPTANDVGDADIGPNGLQNFPVITAVGTTGGATTIDGTLNSKPNTTCRIEFFASDAADPSSFGEGQAFLGFADVTTDAAGNATFDVTLPAATTPTQFITATATGPDGTSEFSRLVANLALTASHAPDPAAVGQDLTYTLTVTNTGVTSPSGQVKLTDTLPVNVTFVSAATSQGTFTQSGRTVTFDLGVIPLNGGAATATITVRPTAAAAGTTLTDTATVTSTVNDPGAADDTATATTDVVAAPAGGADLAVTVTDEPDPVSAGDDITYTITVANAGPDPAANVTLTDAIPAHTTFVSFTAPAGFTVTVPPAGGTGTVTATAASLADGASAVFTLVVRVAPDTSGDTTISNTATVAATTTDPAPNDNSATATTAVNAAPAGADLAVTIAAAPDPVTVGNDLTYTITIHNGGAITATGVKLTDRLPASVTFVSATGGVTPSDGVLTFDLGTLGGGADATVSLVVVPEAAGRLINLAEAKANEADAVATDNADSLDTEVSRIATTTTVTPSSTTAIRGQAVTFVVSVAHPSSPGAGPSGSVTLRDGTTDLGSAPLDAGGTATFMIPDLTIGSHAITASYAGDARFEPSDAAAVTVRIDPAPPGSAPATTGGPIAVPDEYRMLARTRLTVSTSQGVLRNDLGSDGPLAQARLVQGPGHGRLAFLTDGTFRYVPRANFHGTDSFTYVASDRRGDSAPTVVRIRVELLRLERRTFVVPGDPPDPVSLRFTWRLRDARFNNELGVIRVDDSDGSIGGIRPGDRRYLRAAAAAGRMRVVFHSGESAGISREIALRGGERFLVYLVQDRSTAMALARNAEDRPGRSPRVFYSDPAANPDRFAHVRAGGRDGSLSLAWEDVLGGGDRDFNDMVLTIRAIRLGR